ncbi:MAG: beta-ketoacyl-[acyl-carrier-protein] synthase family protein [Planctomycetes bacterium]|nr:beta-ketoacyl-[acyl-carrier-protein] synthase family protein [Planctomycetota bacterium]
MRDNTVWITGIGAVTPLGNDFSTFADNLLAGRSGVRETPLYPHGPLPRQFAAAIGDIPVPPGWDPGSFSQLARLEQLSLSCAARALTDAGLWEQRQDLRVGIVLGMGAEYLRVWELDILAGGRRVFEPERDVQSVVHAVREKLDLSGPAAALAAACASSGFALALARRWIQLDLVDVCLAGGCDLVTPMAYAGFHNLRALSRRTDDPEKASRPFDRDRDGFVMGEGGTVFVLEPNNLAGQRDARVYGELAGCGTTSDASHMVIPSSDPQPASRAMQMALENAGVRPQDLGYVNAHAAGTPVGDRAETRALRLALGESAMHVPVSSTKSMTGHLLSAAAAVEAMACLVALQRQTIPPTINLDNPDEECCLLHVANQAWDRPVRVAASNSFGFGGSNICLVLRAA